VPDGSNILFDGGSTDEKSLGQYTLVPALKSRGVKNIDYAIVSHLDNDHYSGVLYILENQRSCGIKIENLMLPKIFYNDEAYARLAAAAYRSGTNVKLISAGMNLTGLNGRFDLVCLAPGDNRAYSDINEGSLILKMSYGDFDMLFTGDVQGQGEKDLTSLSGLSACDVLKVAHHGSSGSSSEKFLSRVNPRVALISCGVDNSYNHPHRETLERLEACGADIYNTAQDGMITVTTNGSGYGITRFLDRNTVEY